MYPGSHLFPPHPRQSCSTPNSTPATSGPSNIQQSLPPPPPRPFPHPHPRSNTAPSVYRPYQSVGSQPAPAPPPLSLPPLLSRVPVRSSPGVPPSLMPGRKRDEGLNSQESALFFQQSQRKPSHPILAQSLYNDSVVRIVGEPPPLRPALPPKVPVSSSMMMGMAPSSAALSRSLETSPGSVPSGPNPRSTSLTTSPVNPSLSPPGSSASRSSEDLARALALSLAEDVQGRARQNEDDEELARALQESMTTFNSGSGQDTNAASSNTGDATPNTSPSRGSTSSPGNRNVRSNAVDSSVSELQPLEERRRSSSGSFVDDAARLQQQLEQDEQLAREIEMAETPVAMKAVPTVNPVGPNSEPANAADLPCCPVLPGYDDVVGFTRPATQVSAQDHFMPAPRPVQSTPPQNFQRVQAIAIVPHPSSLVTAHTRTPPLGRSQSAQPVPTMPRIEERMGGRGRPLVNAEPIPIRRAVSANVEPVSTVPGPSTARTTVEKIYESMVAEDQSKENEQECVTEAMSSKTPSPSPSMPVPPLVSSATDLVDEELLLGVSIGFTPPTIAAALDPLKGPIPNVMSLPYGRCSPLHIKAPSWKQLLKLLAQLSDSRIEPTTETLAEHKHDMKLRTVIQFIRVHHSSEEWLTVIYLTIDHPVPPALPIAYKFTNNDVSMLPFSYTLSQPPALLGEGADTVMSKYYTIPNTDNLPYPDLPIKLPNLSRYLLAALTESRRASNDSSGGLRKLAKMVDSFYPSDPSDNAVLGPEAALPDRLRMGAGFFRRAIGLATGRAGRDNRNGSENTDSYEYITPYRLDEWG